MLSFQSGRSKNTVVLLTLALLVVVLILAGVVTLRQQLWMISNRQKVLASYELSGLLEKPLTLLKDAENAEQAYLLTGDENCLQPLKKAEAELDPTFISVERQFHNDAKAVKQISELKDYYDREITQLRQTISERHRVAGTPAAALPTKELIAKIRANTHELPMVTYRDQRQFRIAASKELLQQTETSTAELLWLVGLALIGVAGTALYAIYQLRGKDRAIEMVNRVALETVATQEKLAAVLSSMDEGLCLIDKQGKLTYINQAGECLLGYKMEEILDADLHTLVHHCAPGEKNPAAHVCPMLTVMDTGVAYRAPDESFVCKGGALLPVHYVSSPLIANGTITGAVLAFFNISDRKVDETLLKAQHEVTTILAEGVDLNQSVDQISRLICNYFDWQLALLWLVEGDTLLCRTIIRPADSDFSHFASLSQSYEFEKGIGLPGRVWAKLESAWIVDVVEDPNFPRADAAEADNLHGAFALPVMAGTNFVGVLEFFSHSVRPVDQSQIDVLGAICAQVGQFIRRLRAFEQLAISEGRYSLAVEGSMDGIWDWNVETGEIFLSPRWKELLGYGTDELMVDYLQFEKLVHPDDLNKLREALDNHIHGLTPAYNATFRVRAKEGDYRWLSGRGRVVRDADGKVVRMAGSNRDITQEKEAAERLRQSERKFRAIFDTTFEFIGLLSPDGTLLDANRSALAFAGVTLEEVAGKPFWEGPWFDQNDFPRLKQAIETAGSGKFDRFELQHTNEQGTITVDFSLTPIADQDGEVVLLVPEGRDISQLKLTESKLLESEALFRQLAENIREIFWIAAPDSSKFFYVSPAYEEITGKSRDSIESNPRSFWDPLHREDRRRAYWDFKGFAQSKVPREAEYRVIRPDGEVRWIATKVFPIFNENGEVVRSCGVARDINERKEAERRVSEFYSTVSHELRSPLTSIRGSLGLIEGGVVGEASEQVLTFVTIARTESDRLIRLINNILDLRKIEAGSLELKLAEMSVKELVDCTVNSLQGMAAEKHIELSVTQQSDYVLSADKDQINQVLTNLISNAIKFSPEGGNVTVRLQDDGRGFLRFEVVDQGPGIPAGQAHKLFGKFQQLDSSDTRSKGGTGLGLAISKAIVEQHGGVIGFDSVEGEGAVFWFQLPLVRLDAAKKYKALVFSSGGALSERLRGLVSSDPSMSIKVVPVDCLNDATRLLKGGGFDVLILDVGNEPAAAFDLLAQMPEFKRPIPVIVVSGELVKNGVFGDAFVLDGIVDPLDGPTFTRAIADSIARSQAKSPQVLIVEDDPSTRAVVKEQLAELGIHCMEASDGERALELVRIHIPDLIVLDVGLPKLDGFDVVSALRKEAPNLPVIIYTARDLSREDKDALSMGMTRYLTKSQSSVHDLLAAVRELLSGTAVAKS